MPLNNGEEFAGYLIQRLLGTGGMGEVYLAQHPRLPRQDALKILSPTSTADTEFRARFIREAELAATLRHPHIVGVLDRGEFNGRLWITMDYVDGTDAGRLLKDSYPGGMPEQDVAEIVTAVADALDFAHERRLLHRDVKPENILVTANDGRRRRVLLTDFGIARRIDDVGNLTDDNVAVGTVNYMAPEQLRGQSIDGRADQYALAATTFHLLTGAPPFHDANRAVVIGHHLGTPPPRISERRPELAHLDGVLARALAKDPDERYPSCLDFAQALTQQGPRDDVTQPHPPFGAQPTRSPGRSATQRLERVLLTGTAHNVRRSAVGAGNGLGTLSFLLTPGEPAYNLPASVPVEIRTQLVAGQLSDGDQVQASGVWDGRTLDADELAILPGGQPSTRRPARAKGPQATSPLTTSPQRRSGRTKALAALGGVIVVAAVALVWFTDGFGLWNRPGPVVKPVSAKVFSPSGAADNPQKAGLAIDGNPDTAWPTVTYTDPVPFPNFSEGEGLMLHLAEPTALSAVTVDLSSTGTEVQIRSSPTEDPAKLADTTELTPTTPLQPGSNRIEVHDRTKTSNVLVWISTLGTTDGQSRTEISEITLQAAR
ncbi:protein kinase family protein [Mycolicibacterium chubuense NBB4]|uniref:non-specific serine/threonine protein kinase n=1 Tax=Mycolicibacterium chubuense (strain NBB4) TaxID=710421 RepID=I4BGL1_MYCCN|nr:serine/threonine-protein kinase [Mycolicibacterium chubuense]AFM16418.1 protein kinase family protein [Mycolicibacterium chubuense NBB4]